MGNLKLTNVTKNMKTSIEKHTPEILMGFGIAGMITAIIVAVKSTPKAIELIEEKKQETGSEKLTIGETVKTAWKCYIPTTVIAATSTVCLIGSSKVNLRRNAALATAYKIAETAHREYRDKVIETIGEKKEQAIKDKVAKDKIDNNPSRNCEIYITNNGNTLCYDVLSGRYFRTNIDKIKKVENELNRRMLLENYISLNDFYDELGLKRTKMGEDLGWKVENGYLDLSFSSQLTEDDEPCLVVDYGVEPKYDYYKAY